MKQILIGFIFVFVIACNNDKHEMTNVSLTFASAITDTIRELRQIVVHTSKNGDSIETVFVPAAIITVPNNTVAISAYSLTYNVGGQLVLILQANIEGTKKFYPYTVNHDQIAPTIEILQCPYVRLDTTIKPLPRFYTFTFRPDTTIQIFKGF